MKTGCAKRPRKDPPVEHHAGLLDVLLDDLDLADGLVGREGGRVDIVGHPDEDVVVVRVQRHHLGPEWLVLGVTTIVSVG